MPGYPWLATATIDGAQLQVRMKALTRVGVPYSDQDIQEAPAAVKGKTEMDAMIAYLQGLGTALR
jgi:cytochrome c oxidase cbb3-type subunit 2